MSTVVIGLLDAAIEALETNSTSAPVLELVKAAKAALCLERYNIHSDAWDIWPEDTEEHARLRSAYMQGALDATPVIEWKQ